MLLKNKVLLDTSAFLAWLKNENGAEVVRGIIKESAMSLVNIAELVSTLTKEGYTQADVNQIIQSVSPVILPFNEDIAFEAGLLISKTKEYGLSLGDRACIITALHYNLELYTADKIWVKLDIKNLKLRLIR